MKHLTEEEIQCVVEAGDTCLTEEQRFHLLNCSLCQEVRETYATIFTALKQEQSPELSPDFTCNTVKTAFPDRTPFVERIFKHESFFALTGFFLFMAIAFIVLRFGTDVDLFTFFSDLAVPSGFTQFFTLLKQYQDLLGLIVLGGVAAAFVAFVDNVIGKKYGWTAGTENY